jgi:tetratricopeptide (TPR) repeat protein
VTDHRYKAFVSYSWADAAWGKWLLHALETYRTPAALVGKQGALGPVPARLMPLFKDREEEAAGASIGKAVEAALAGSEFLIVICSPRSAASKWVNHEVAWFKTHRDPERILALIVDGEPHSAEAECFPKALTHRVLADLTITDEPEDAPLAADARDSGDGKRKARLKLAAALLGVGLDELVGRDDRRRALRQRWVTAGSLLFGGSMAALAWAAVQARDEAQVQRGQAEGLVEYMIGDLRKKLQPKVQIEVLGGIADRAQAFYAVQSKYPMDDEALARRARVLKLLGEIEMDQGHSDVSLKLFEQSVTASRELLTRDPDNPDRILEQAYALQRLGNVLFQQGDMAGAEAQMQEAANLTTHLVEDIGDIGQRDEWLAEHGSALANLGIVQLQQRRLEPAIANLNRALAIKESVTIRTPTNWQAQYDLATTLAWAAEAAVQEGDESAALKFRLAEEKLYRAMMSASPDDLAAQSGLNANGVKQAESRLLQGDIRGAYTLAQTIATDSEILLRADFSNTEKIEGAARAQSILAEAALMIGDVSKAEAAVRRAEALAERLIRIDPSVTNWIGPLLGNARILRFSISARSVSGLSACRAVLAPSITEARRLDRLSDANPTIAKLALITARANLLRGDHAALSGNTPAARAAWQRAVALINRAASANVAPKGRASLQLIEQATVRLAGATPQTMGCGR